VGELMGRVPLESCLLSNSLDQASPESWMEAFVKQLFFRKLFDSNLVKSFQGLSLHKRKTVLMWETRMTIYFQLLLTIFGTLAVLAAVPDGGLVHLAHQIILIQGEYQVCFVS
jgi:hypothetical protein